MTSPMLALAIRMMKDRPLVIRVLHAKSQSSSSRQELLKKRMQVLLNRQYRADKRAEKERQEKAEQERVDREEELREMSIKLRRRMLERERLMHQDSDEDNFSLSGSISLSPNSAIHQAGGRGRSKSNSPKGRRSPKRRERSPARRRRTSSPSPRRSRRRSRSRSRSRSRRDSRGRSRVHRMRFLAPFVSVTVPEQCYRLWNNLSPNRCMNESSSAFKQKAYTARDWG
ncbi:Hypothetical predicted protein [Cloeon dipterum]|uniref:CLK4-associating serine/arginine rich protein n=1 Tax=Cloeon dipterum TaxID=197152 RepID=A0A8S1CBP2_9INSE|nr:Hypothetical predicted protein [Cloeon dipterum]